MKDIPTFEEEIVLVWRKIKILLSVSELWSVFVGSLQFSSFKTNVLNNKMIALTWAHSLKKR